MNKTTTHPTAPGLDELPKRAFFRFHREWLEQISEMPTTAKVAMYNAICDYALDCIEPDWTTPQLFKDLGIEDSSRLLLKVAWPPIREKIDFGRQKWLNSLKCSTEEKATITKPRLNQDSTKTEPRFNQDSTKTEPKCNLLTETKTETETKEPTTTTTRARFGGGGGKCLVNESTLQCNIPTLEDVAEYCKKMELNFTEPAEFLRDCEVSNWTDSNGNPLRAWKKYVIGYNAQRKKRGEPLAEWAKQAKQAKRTIDMAKPLYQ